MKNCTVTQRQFYISISKFDFSGLIERETQVLGIRQILFSSQSCFPTGRHLLRAINVPCPWSPLSSSGEI